MQKQIFKPSKGISYSQNLPQYDEDQSKRVKQQTKSNNGKKSIQEWNEINNPFLINEFNNRKDSEERSKLEKLIKKDVPNQFGSQILVSEQISIASSQNHHKNILNEVQFEQMLENKSDFQLLNEMKNQQISRPIYFNVIIVGASGIGKTSFIDAFLNRKFQQNSIIRQATTQIIYHNGTRTQGHLNFKISMIDTPGYKENKESAYYKLIKNEITNKFKKNIQQNKFDRKKIIQGDKSIKDERIHCCLYFISGPRINQQDGFLMKKLQKYVTIIPILAKGDCYTEQEIKEIKKQIIAQKQKLKLQWLECQEILRSKNPGKLKQLLEGPFGKAPPFLMVSCIKKLVLQNRKVIFGRKYNWGICDIQNPHHSDFLLLYNLLIVFFSLPLISLTKIAQQNYLRKLEKSEASQGTKNLVGLGVCTVAVALIYKMVNRYIN